MLMYSVYTIQIHNYIMEETDMKDIKWAVLGTGVIANEMAVALKKNGRNIYAVGNRTYDKAVAFAEKYGIGKVYSDYNEMFTDPEVDVSELLPWNG